MGVDPTCFHPMCSSPKNGLCHACSLPLIFPPMSFSSSHSSLLVAKVENSSAHLSKLVAAHGVLELLVLERNHLAAEGWAVLKPNFLENLHSLQLSIVRPMCVRHSPDRFAGTDHHEHCVDADRVWFLEQPCVERLQLLVQVVVALFRHELLEKPRTTLAVTEMTPTAPKSCRPA